MESAPRPLEGRTLFDGSLAIGQRAGRSRVDESHIGSGVYRECAKRGWRPALGGARAWRTGCSEAASALPRRAARADDDHDRDGREQQPDSQQYEEVVGRADDGRDRERCQDDGGEAIAHDSKRDSPASPRAHLGRLGARGICAGAVIRHDQPLGRRRKLNSCAGRDPRREHGLAAVARRSSSEYCEICSRCARSRHLGYERLP